MLRRQCVVVSNLGSQTLIPPLSTSMKSQTLLQLTRKLKGATKSALLHQVPHCPSQPWPHWATSTGSLQILNSFTLPESSKLRLQMQSQPPCWVAMWETGNKSLLWCPVSMTHKKTPSHSRDVPITVLEWTPNILLSYLQGNILPWLATSKGPVPLSHLLAFFFSSIYKQLPSFCNEYIAKYTGDQNTSSITYQVWDVLILHSFFQLDLYLNLSIILLVPIFKACSIKLTIDLEILKLLLAAVQQEQAMHMLLFASRIDFSVQ